MNCHFISHFLTKPWEIGQRQLRYVDLDQDRVKRKSSRSLFAEEGLNDEDIEARLGLLVETPLGDHRDTILTSETAVIGEWRVFRALALMLLLQAPRAARSMKTTETDLVQRILRLEEERIDAMVLAYRDHHLLVRIHVHPADRLMFPCTGIFAFPIVDRGCAAGWSFGFGLPLSPRVFVAGIPRTRSTDHLDEMSRRPSFFGSLSAGFADHCSKLVLPPDVGLNLTDDAILATVRRARRENRTLMESVGEARNLIARAYAAAGIVEA